jgi:hypothetical protein
MTIESSPWTSLNLITSAIDQRSKRVMASLEKSRNSLQTGVGVEPLFMLRCDRSPVMLTWFRQQTLGRSTLHGVTLPRPNHVG